MAAFPTTGLTTSIILLRNEVAIDINFYEQDVMQYTKKLNVMREKDDKQYYKSHNLVDLRNELMD